MLVNIGERSLMSQFGRPPAHSTLLRGLQGSRTLTVDETEGFAVLGGVINLTVEDNKVHFEINRLAADRAGLKIGSRLLSIAKIVKQQDHGRKS
jgi:hypothetical protein